MRMAEAGVKGGSYVDASARHGVGDFGISVSHRPRWCQRAAASSLNRLPDHSILSGEQFAEPSVFAAGSARSSAGIAFHL